MPSTEPPDLPRLPPIRESAEQALPPAAGDEPLVRGREEPDLEGPTSEDRAGEGATGTRPERQRGARGRRPRDRRAAVAATTAAPAAPAAPEPAGRATRRRGDRVPRSEDGRRLSTAGHALIVSVLALIFGALLLAPGMHKAAYNGQPGTKRDVSLALTAGLAHVSHALLLDRPRKLVQDAMGRQRADEINVAIDVPSPTTTPATTTPASTTPTTTPATKPQRPVKPTKLAFTPKRKLKLWIAGDSLVITPGYAIDRAADGSPVIQSVGGVDGHVATGLTRPDVFNWFLEIADQVKKLKPNVVVLNFGGNDDHGYMTGLPSGTSIGDFGSPTWSAEYLRRVRVVLDTVNRAGGTVVWIGLPITNSEAQTQRFDTLNAIVQRETKRRGPRKAIFIDTYTMFAGDNGGFTEYLENGKGDSIKVRAGDGVHFDVAGGDMIAREVLRRLNTVFDLTSWRKQKGA
jgi:hypothetical protein